MKTGFCEVRVVVNEASKKNVIDSSDLCWRSREIKQFSCYVLKQVPDEE